ncbi:hypothetical protein EJP77_14975 [Paenibacillus zeisoli]|uniref:Uncharacterized protein n=1 Tax=Paenibacillus zeisoli TaxID=2496267 RepID=A0A3S1JMF2_9BACL|nr:hypothetical protein [Paenibacillus zeisoli]RUT29665.1 hypothetical protein EJP77_14975 [Paenibacillus zeisoli]
MRRHAMILLLLALFVTILTVGCSRETKQADIYTAAGNIASLERTGGVTDGVRSEYVVKLTELKLAPQNSDQQTGFFSVTKNTVIYRTTHNKKIKVNVPAIEIGRHAEITWRFANDHLIEALEIDMK